LGCESEIVLFASMQVRPTKEQKIQILNRKDLYPIMRRILIRQGKIRARQEYLWIVGLQTNNTIDFIELLNIGTLNSIQLLPRELFRIAVIKNVDKVILVHNHPSGSLIPSRADKSFTASQKTAGELLGVRIVDHLIISDKGYFSFLEKNLI